MAAMSTVTYQLADLWEALAEAGPDDECLVAGDVRHTRGSLDRAANRVANLLVERGVQPGQRVGIYARNRAEFIEALLACWKVAAIPVNINWRYVAEELRYILDDAGLVAVFVERGYLPVLDELAADFPGIHTNVVLEDGTDHQPANLETLAWEEAVGRQPATGGFDVPRIPDDVYILYTGGTTGMPKGVMWRHEDFFFACLMGGTALGPISSPEQIRDNVVPVFRVDSVILGPLMHGAGQWNTLIALYSGGKAILYMGRSYEPAAVLDLIGQERPTSIGLTGDAMGRQLAETVLAHPDRWDVSSLVSVGNGGATLTGSVKQQLHLAFPDAVIYDAFGSSETGAAGRGFDEGESSDTPVFVVDDTTAVLDPATLRPVTPGSDEQGLFARRGHIPLGYWNDEVKTRSTFVTDEHGVRWVLPGDHAKVDDQGRILLLGRGSVCINTGGEKVFPEEVEAAIRSHPAVFDAVVVGVPDERWGQRVAALVQLRDGVEELTLEELQTHCRTKVAGYKVPRDLVLGAAPRTNVGKADYGTASSVVRERLGLS